MKFSSYHSILMFLESVNESWYDRRHDGDGISYQPAENLIVNIKVWYTRLDESLLHSA